MIKNMICIILIFLIQNSLGKRCDSLIDLGDQHYDAFRNKEALEYYKQAYASCSGQYEPLMKMVRGYIDAGEDDGKEFAEDAFVTALRYADTLQRSYPDSVESYFLKAVAAGNLALFRGGTEKVKLVRIIESNLKKAIARDSLYDPAYVVLGAYYREVATANSVLKFFAKSFLGGMPDGTLQESQQYLLKALELNPRNMFGHLELAKTYIAMGEEKKEESVKHLNTVLQLPVTNHQHPQLKKEAQQLLRSLK